jgi:hypothetical protein
MCTSWSYPVDSLFFSLTISYLATPTTTLMPWAALPPCAQQCYKLYDANGACVPPVAPQGPASAYEACFCAYADLQPLKTAANGVCSAAQCDAAGFNSIQAWFNTLCAGKAVATNTGTAGSSPTRGSSNGASGGNGNGGDW